MQSGLKQGASGPDVEQLHHILQAAGLVIDPKDLGGSAFGPSTVAALKALQVQHGLPVSGEVDEGTLNVLLAVEKATKDTHAGAAPAHIPSPAIVVIQKGSVHGKVVDEDGNGLTARQYWGTDHDYCTGNVWVILVRVPGDADLFGFQVGGRFRSRIMQHSTSVWYAKASKENHQ